MTEVNTMGKPRVGEEVEEVAGAAAEGGEAEVAERGEEVVVEEEEALDETRGEGVVGEAIKAL